MGTKIVCFLLLSLKCLPIYKNKIPNGDENLIAYPAHTIKINTI